MGAGGADAGSGAAGAGMGGALFLMAGAPRFSGKAGGLPIAGQISRQPEHMELTVVRLRTIVKLLLPSRQSQGLPMGDQEGRSRSRWRRLPAGGTVDRTSPAGTLPPRGLLDGARLRREPSFKPCGGETPTPHSAGRRRNRDQSPGTGSCYTLLLKLLDDSEDYL